MKNKYIALIVAIILIPMLLVILPYMCKFFSFQLSSLPAEWGTFGDYFGGLLNPYISLLTLFATIYIAYTLYTYERKRDEQSKQEADVKSFMELYQFFITKEFREVRTTAWYVLKKAVFNENYKEFLIKENYVARYINRKPRADVYHEFKTLLFQLDHPQSLRIDNQEAFVRQEAADRNNIDILINFFQLLSFKDVPEDYYKICDFYYDTWRPVLYWYANELAVAYTGLEGNKKFNNPPSLLEALEKLDKKFYRPDTLLALKEIGYTTHPIIVHMKSNQP
jgi:hypothetical protein